MFKEAANASLNAYRAFKVGLLNICARETRSINDYINNKAQNFIFP